MLAVSERRCVPRQRGIFITHLRWGGLWLFVTTRTRTGRSFASFQTTERSISTGRWPTAQASNIGERWQRSAASPCARSRRRNGRARRTCCCFTAVRWTDGETQTTARSVIRGLMRSKAATPYIVRNQCIQHHSCFVAAIRPLKSATAPPPIDLRNARLYRRRQTSPQPLREAPRR